MEKETVNNHISSELLAAYLDGSTTAAENLEILNALEQSPELREVMSIAQAIDDDCDIIALDSDILPMTAMAATCGEENYCSLECEKYILTKRQIPFDERELLSNAIGNKWQKREGTALFNIGRHLESKGLVATRRYQCTLDDIVDALKQGADLIAAVDGGELIGDPAEELAEDLFIGQIPDHTVIILDCDIPHNTITIYDPDTPNAQDSYSIPHFMDAWADSKYYLVTVTPEFEIYVPHPIDLSDVELTDDLDELREAIAENAHEVWAENRQAQGWTYGPRRDDALKQTPDMVPYSQLPDSEKLYDREMAMNTIKLLKKLGYDIVKRKK